MHRADVACTAAYAQNERTDVEIVLEAVSHIGMRSCHRTHTVRAPPRRRHTSSMESETCATITRNVIGAAQDSGARQVVGGGAVAADRRVAAACDLVTRSQCGVRGSGPCVQSASGCPWKQQRLA